MAIKKKKVDVLGTYLNKKHEEILASVKMTKEKVKELSTDEQNKHDLQMLEATYKYYDVPAEFKLRMNKALSALLKEGRADRVVTKVAASGVSSVVFYTGQRKLHESVLNELNSETPNDNSTPQCWIMRAEKTDSRLVSESNLDQSLGLSVSSMTKSLMGNEGLSAKSIRRIENVDWKDFISYKYLLEPVYFKRNIIKERKGLLDALRSNREENKRTHTTKPAKSAQVSAEPVMFTSFIAQFNEKTLSTMDVHVNLPILLSEEAAFDEWCDINRVAIILSKKMSDIYAAYESAGAEKRNRLLTELKPTYSVAGQVSYPMSYFSFAEGLALFLNARKDPLNAELQGRWQNYRGQLVGAASGYWKKEIDRALEEAKKWEDSSDTTPDSVDVHVKNELKDLFKSSQPRSKTVSQEYLFDYFRPGTINLGLRFVHRQEWRPLDVQAGEVVKTIPLGPKQIEKITIKTIEKKKNIHVSDDLTARESSTETTSTDKETTDVVNEASKSFGWKVGANAEAEWGWGKAGITAEMDSKTQNSSKESNNHLSESIQKAASKLRKESKVTITTEFENSIEQEKFSEIQNPNDEIAVTFIYSKMQRQYEVFTGLSEISDVIMIAEPMPAPEDITVNWVRKNDWVLGQNLIDASFAEALSSIVNDIDPKDMMDPPTEMVSSLMEQAKKSMNSLASSEGSKTLASIDVIERAQSAYYDTSKEVMAMAKARSIIKQKHERFLQHIRDNILHYQRAIWSQEHPDQRLLRYAKLKIQIPLKWKFKVKERELSLSSLVASQEFLDFIIKGSFVPDFSNGNGSPEENYVSLHEILATPSPIGYFGNYAIFEMKSNEVYLARRTQEIFNILDIVKKPYLNDDGGLIDPAFKTIKSQVTSFPNEMTPMKRFEFVDLVPSLRSYFFTLREEKQNALLNGSFDEFTKFVLMVTDDLVSSYQLAMYRKTFSRRFLVDTNNLMIDLEKGESKLLEPFKVDHRKIDVAKADEEMKKMQLENQRRALLMSEKKYYGDPDVDKIVAITTADRHTSLLAIEEASKDDA